MEDENKINEEDKEKDKEPEIPPSPKTKVSLRTMETDKSSLKNSGGEPPKPILVELEAEPEETENENEEVGQKEEGRSEKKSPEPLIKKAPHKGLIIGISIFVFGVIVFFFFVYILPLISFKPIPSQPLQPGSKPAANQTKAPAKQSPPLPNKNQPIVPQAVIPQVSSKVETVLIDPLTLDNIKNALKEKANDLKEGDLKIIAFLNPNGTIKASDFLQVVLKNSPAFSNIKKEDLEKIFEDVFAGFLYKKKSKLYLGYTFLFKPEIVQIQIQALLNPILEDKDHSLLSNILWRDLTKEDKLYHYYTGNNLIISTYNIDQEFIKNLLK